MISVANMGSMIMFRMSVAIFSEKLFKTAPSQMFDRIQDTPLKGQNNTCIQMKKKYL